MTKSIRKIEPISVRWPAKEKGPESKSPIFMNTQEYPQKRDSKINAIATGRVFNRGLQDVMRLFKQ
jgi:hypothetical protein|tara:strand:+ start:441 stop:638 length:198 start_codon:yes stop_codon:yes gene_type:complete